MILIKKQNNFFTQRACLTKLFSFGNEAQALSCLGIAIVFLFISFNLSGQKYGNEWINYSQKYYKFSIVKNGLYRIDSSALAKSGISVSSIDPRNLQIFNRGIEIAIFINGENDGTFNASDYIELYAEKNDGYLDSILYKGAQNQANPWYSLFSDTAAYFLTWNNSTSNKRMSVETDTAFSFYNADAWIFKEALQQQNSTYYNGETNAINATDNEYVPTEGWFGNEFSYSAQGNVTVNTPNVFPSGPPAEIKMAIASESNHFMNPDQELTVKLGSTTMGTYTYDGYKLNRYTYAVAASSLSPSSIFTFINNKPAATASQISSSGRSAIAWITIKYPHKLDLSGATEFSLSVPDNVTQPSAFLKFSNFNDQNTPPVLHDISNHKIIPIIKQSGFYNALLPNSGGEKKCFLSSGQNIITLTNLKPVNGTGTFNDFSVGAPDSAYIIVTHSSLMTEANNYKNYRSSIAGRSFKVILVSIDELYDQFAHGIKKHPLALRRFAEYAINKFPSAPQYLFLLGKSIHASSCRQNASNYSLNLVPSFGNPSSDILITSRMNGTILELAIPTGRLSARTPADISLYLNKIKEYESAPAGEWMKRGIHFGGGTDLYQQNQFASYLLNFEKTFEDTLFGGKISTFLKTSTAPIQINLSDSIRKLIDGGVSIMTMFGHASLNNFDQSIDKPATYNNKGKYPFMLSNGCYSGDIHTSSVSSSEEFVLIKDKGVIAYLGNVFLGVPQELNIYSDKFYLNFCNENYGKPVGKIIQKTIKTIQSINPQNNTPLKAVCLEMTLHGDPALVINSPKLPDYSITNQDVFFDVTSQVDSITVFGVIQNAGRAIRDSFIVEVIRTFPDASKTIYQKKISAPLYRDTIPFTIPADYTNGNGLNKIKITLDRFAEIAELSETNNSTTPEVDLFLKGIDIVPVYPYKYAVIPGNTVTLKASITNVFAAVKKYAFQMDTTDAFASPLAQTTISSGGGVISWTPSITLSDSVVYYWRVSPDSAENNGYNWKESSFQYIQGKRGWGQAHFFQFKNDKYQYVTYNKPQRKFEFANDVKSISVQTGINSRWDDVWYKINAGVMYYSSCAIPGFSFVVFNPISASPILSVYKAGYGQYGNFQCDPLDGNAFDFFTFKDPATGDTAIWRKKIRDFIDSIPAGYPVLAYSQGDPDIHRDSTLYSSFEKLGSGKIRVIPNNRAYILWGKKGSAKGSAVEINSSSANAAILYEDTLISNWNNGSIQSEIIGPAQSWGSLHWRQHPVEGTSKDSVQLRLIGIKANNEEIVLINGLPVDSGDIYNLATYADASVYPYLKLVAFMKDDSLRTPAHLDRWQVLYTPVPEAAVNPQLGFYFYKDALQEGEDMKFSLAVQNIGEIDFADTLMFSYSIYNKERKKINLPFQQKVPPLKVSDWVMDTILFNTNGYAGLNSLWFEFNPLNQQHSQMEQYHYNNTALLDFLVTKDKVNPLLDITFDGTHILNGDIVSGKPIIQIQLKDENKFLALNDTSDFAVYITKPSQIAPVRIYFGELMKFTPAVLPANSCKITYNPTYALDGKYRLSVEAKDRSDNHSGTVSYDIEFEVINKQTITSVMNYPNPFSTSTRFVFTLTGSFVPDNFRIQIMTITGKVIKEIDKNELGIIRVGRNITEYAWDGKDEYGDRLANGVYLYRVIVKNKGQSVEKAESGADQYFTKDFGKMYLIR